MRAAAIVRILTGVLFVAEGLSKVTGDFVRGGFAGPLGHIAAGAFPFWKRFLETTVAPHADAFAAAGGALMMLAIALGAARPEPGASWDDWITSGLTPKLALLLFVLLCAVDPGKVWGLDARRARKARPARA